jgi:hypothetical protein
LLLGPPGFRCGPSSAVHPLRVDPLAFRDMPLTDHRLGWIRPDIPMAQTVADDSAATPACGETKPGWGTSRGAASPVSSRALR